MLGVDLPSQVELLPSFKITSKLTKLPDLSSCDLVQTINSRYYKVHQLHSQPTKSGCGGVAMYVKKSLDHKVLNHLNVLEDEFETLRIEINTGPKCKNIIVCCAYRHPDTDANKFIEYLESTFSKLDKNKIICIMGDFNINLLNYESHSDTNQFINSMVPHCLLPRILQPIRVTDHSATVIDNIFTNATDFDTTSGNILNQLADHFSQFLILKKLNIIHKDSSFYKYDYSNFDKDNFVSDFTKVNWNENKNITPGDVNAKFYNFYDKVSICVKKHVPFVKLSRKQLSLRAKPWITVRIESMMAKRDKYLRKFNRTHSLDMEYLYKKFRNKVVSEVRKSKNEYYAEYLQSIKLI